MLFRDLCQKLKACKDKNILIHCSAGVSRSATMVIAYLILNLATTYQEALDILRGVWKQANTDRVYRYHLERL